MLNRKYNEKSVITSQRIEVCKAKKLISRTTKENPSSPVKAYHRFHLFVRCYRNLPENKDPELKKKMKSKNLSLPQLETQLLGPRTKNFPMESTHFPVAENFPRKLAKQSEKRKEE